MLQGFGRVGVVDPNGRTRFVVALCMYHHTCNIAWGVVYCIGVSYTVADWVAWRASSWGEKRSLEIWEWARGLG